MEEAFRDEQGRTLLSRTAVSEVTEKLWEEYEAFVTRDLSEYRIVYLFLDGVAERLRPGQRREAVLCAWGIDEEGKKHLLHLAPGTKEDTESLRASLQEMKRQRLRDPLLVVTGDAGGLIRALEECQPWSLRQRCLVRKKRNLARKVREDRWAEFKENLNACYQAPSMEVARMMKDEVVARYQKELRSAIRCFLEYFDACIAHLRFPHNDRKAIRTINLLERLLEEDRRRTKGMPNAFGERVLLKVMYAAVIWGFGEVVGAANDIVRSNAGSGHSERTGPRLQRSSQGNGQPIRSFSFFQHAWPLIWEARQIRTDRF